MSSHCRASRPPRRQHRDTFSDWKRDSPRFQRRRYAPTPGYSHQGLLRLAKLNIRFCVGALRTPPRAPRTMRVGKLVSPMGANERGDWAAVV